MPDSDAAVMTSAATTGHAIPLLRVASLDASLAYYVAQLGFEVEWRSDPVASVRRSQTAVMLCEGDQGHAGTWLWISVSDVDALYAELASRGARLRNAPTNHPWGSRECQVTDLDDHVLRFGGELKKGEPMGAWLDGAGRRWIPTPDGGWRADQ